MAMRTIMQRIGALAIIVSATGCSTLDSSVTGPTEGAFRLVRAAITRSDYELLDITAQLTNTGTVPLRGGGCMRPDVAIDVQTAGSWTPLDVLQTSELVLCVQAFTLAPGTTSEFTTSFRRARSEDVFPRDRPLRLRVVLQSGSEGPVLPITIR
jgi:hypothetical protein